MHRPARRLVLAATSRRRSRPRALPRRRACRPLLARAAIAFALAWSGTTAWLRVARFLRRVGRLVRIVISRDLLVATRRRRRPARGRSARSAARAARGSCSARGWRYNNRWRSASVGLRPAVNAVDRDDRGFALARFQQHRSIRRRHADRHARVGRDRRQHQPLEQPAGDVSGGPADRSAAAATGTADRPAR